MTKVGERVVAIRDGGKNGEVNIFGFGVYEGDFLPPGAKAEDFVSIMREVIGRELTKPMAEKLAFVRDIEETMCRLDPSRAMPTDEVLTERIEAANQHHREILAGGDEAVLAYLLKRKVGTNPRIRITEGPNEGRAVWGMECWWGSVAGFERAWGGMTVNVVPLERPVYPEDDATGGGK